MGDTGWGWDSDSSSSESILISLTGEIDRAVDEIVSEMKEAREQRLLEKKAIKSKSKRLPQFGPFNAHFKAKRKKMSARRLRY